MKKQRTVNTVTANDEFSSGLMESYGRWMGGEGFQNSTIAEEEIPTGQKQGGGSGAAFTTAIGSLPAIEFDSSTGLPTIPELGVSDDTSQKDPKATSNGGEPPTNKNGEKPKYGAQIRNTVLVGANEGKDHSCCKKCGSMSHTTEECKATKEEVEKYQWDIVSEALTLLGELTESKYTVKGEKLNEESKEEPEINIMDTHEWKDAAKKQTTKIMDMWKKG